MCLSLPCLIRSFRLMPVCTLILIGVLAASDRELLAGEAEDTPLSFKHQVPLHPTGSGSLTVSARVGDIGAEFLVDTGASMVTLDRILFQTVSRNTKYQKTKSVAARMADGKIHLLDVYHLEHFFINGDCDLGPLEIAVESSGGRNLLGMNALQQAAPFGISIEPPLLGLTRCTGDPLQTLEAD